MKFKAHDYQEALIAFMMSRENAAIFADPGLGKTAVSLSWFAAYKLIFPRARALVVAPRLPLSLTWPNEIEKWDHLRGLRWALAPEPEDGADLYGVNPERLIKYLDSAKQLPDVLIVDESTRFKNPGGKRFRRLRKDLSKFKRRYILTGTPSPQGLEDLWSQFFIVDRGASLEKTVTAYRKKYFIPIPNYGYGGVTWNIRKGAEPEVYGAIRYRSRRIDAADWLDLPELLYNDVWIDLPKEARRVYQDVERELFAQLDNGEDVLANTAGHGYSMCCQIANGGLYTAEPGKTAVIHGAKAEALLDLVDSLQGKPALVAYRFKHDLARLQKARKAPYIGGGVSSRKAIATVDKWNSGALPLLYGHPASMAHGLNLQGAGNDIIWYGLTDSLENYLQFNRRVYRQGVKGQVRVHRILARGTVDEMLVKRMDNKEANQQRLLDALKEYRHGKAG